MGYSGFSYLIVEGFRNVFKNKKASMVSLITMLCAMFLFGTFFAIGENINHLMEQVKKAQGIEIFIKTDASDDETAKLGNEIKAIEGVNTCRFKTKQEALEQMKESLKSYDGNLMDTYEGENNIFPASYIVTLTDLSLSEGVQEKILKLDNVDEITSSDKTIDTLIKISNGLRLAIGVIFVLLLIIAVTIISNTIKLTVHARRKEISIMKYVGATNNFIRWPFIVEGMIIGIFASVISIVIVGGAYSLLAEQAVNAQFMQAINMSLVGFKDMISSIIFVYMLLGIGIGALGSVISMRKYLKV